MGRPRKYKTDEERKAAKAAYLKQWYQDHRAEQLTYNKQRYANHRAEFAAYYQNHKEAHAAKMKQWYQDNKEEIAAQKKQYNAEYYATPFGRAVRHAGHYRAADKKYNRGECTIDAHWIVENVFGGQVCQYCGESDWMKLGVDRIDNTKPHTPDNVRCCCEKCNKKKARMTDIQWLRKLWSECMLQPN